MIIFLYGTDNFRVRQAVKQLTADFRKKSPGVNPETFDLTEAGQMQKLEDNLKNSSLFESKKLLVAKNIFSESEKLAEIIKSRKIPEDKQTILIAVENNNQAALNKKSKKLWNLLTDKPVVSKSLEPLLGGQLEKWTLEKVESSGLKIRAPALRKLLSFAVSNQERLANEIKKLAAFKASQNDAEIYERDVEKLVYAEDKLNNFALIDALASRNRSRAIALLDRHLSAGEDPYALLGLLVYQFRNLLRIKSLVKEAVPFGQLAKLTGLHPFVVKKTYEQAKNFELSELKKIYSQLHSFDTDLKNGQIDPTLAMFKLVSAL